MINLELDLLKTEMNLRKGYKLISWSKFNDFDQCQLKWFINSFAGFPEKDQLLPDSTRSIAGTMIQKIFEHFINDRIYSEFATKEQLYYWFRSNLLGLYKLIAVDKSNHSPELRSRFYFKTNASKIRRKELQTKFPIDSRIKGGLRINFIDYPTFEREQGTEETFLSNLYEMCVAIVNHWQEVKFPLNSIISEIYLNPILCGDLRITGKIDFLVNNHHNIKQDGLIYKLPKQLQHNFSIVDGKLNITKYTNPAQLQFYNALIFTQFRKKCGSLTFYDWNRQQFRKVNIDNNYFNIVKSRSFEIYNTGANLLQYFIDLRKKHKKKKTLLIMGFDERLRVSPSKETCTFCSLKEKCAPCIESGSYDPNFEAELVKIRENKRIVKEDFKKDKSKETIKTFELK